MYIRDCNVDFIQAVNQLVYVFSLSAARKMQKVNYAIVYLIFLSNQCLLKSIRFGIYRRFLPRQDVHQHLKVSLGSFIVLYNMIGKCVNLITFLIMSSKVGYYHQQSLDFCFYRFGTALKSINRRTEKRTDDKLFYPIRLEARTKF